MPFTQPEKTPLFWGNVHCQALGINVARWSYRWTERGRASSYRVEHFYYSKDREHFVYSVQGARPGRDAVATIWKH